MTLKIGRTYYIIYRHPVEGYIYRKVCFVGKAEGDDVGMGYSMLHFVGEPQPCDGGPHFYMHDCRFVYIANVGLIAQGYAEAIIETEEYAIKMVGIYNKHPRPAGIRDYVLKIKEWNETILNAARAL